MNQQDIYKIVEELITNLGLNMKAEVSQDGDFFTINLTGPDTRYLERGKDNRVGAFIVILKLMCKKNFNVEPRFVIDVNNQRKQRIENIVQMARKKAEMVRISGMEEEMPPMTPAERRAVHMEIKEMTGVTTESRGEEPHRRIVIVIAEE